jgi:hypothetical protein
MYLTGVRMRIARDNVRAHLPDALDLAQSGQVEPGRVATGQWPERCGWAWHNHRSYWPGYLAPVLRSRV